MKVVSLSLPNSYVHVPILLIFVIIVALVIALFWITFLTFLVMVLVVKIFNIKITELALNRIYLNIFIFTCKDSTRGIRGVILTA